MDSALFSLVQVESLRNKLPDRPERVVSRNYPAVPQDDPVELRSLSRPNRMSSGATTPREEVNRLDLEMSRPATPTSEREAVDALQSLSNPSMNRFRLAACCSLNLLGGLNDSAAGALIPYMETHYDIGYGIVSLIFVGVALGFILAVPCIDPLSARLGRAKTLALSTTLIASGYVPIVCTAPFPVIVISFFLVGFGYAFNLSIGNVFCANLQNGATMLGAMHGSYGIGGTVGPLIATAMVTAGNTLWSRYYLITLGLALFNIVFATWSYWTYEEDAGAHSVLANNTPSGAKQLSGMLTAIKSRVVIVGAVFIFAYQGAEVSISGWVISFLINSRNGDPSQVGYVSSGFWAGITLGRFLLSPLGSRIGEKRFVYGIVLGSVIFELLVWWVPNVIGDAVSVAIVGLLLGPVYPCAAVVFTRNLSRKEQVSGLSVISAFGSSGGAVAPFVTGILAQAVGTFVLHPIAIGLCGVMMLCWYGIPAVRKRTD
ncbi:major facilitator superfamily domain-containing protein [Xylariales sp. AK1849]|nr:major facilitator superfamily domain-containing protein [Xylariales sp. AK1849]